MISCKRFSVFSNDNMSKIFELLSNCEGFVEKNIHHKEEDLLSHLLQTFKLALRESNDVDLILAALVHDIGKPISSFGHEKIACDILSEHISAKTHFIVEQHMRIKLLLDGKMKKRSKINYLIEHPWIQHLILMARWDTLGRKPKVNIEFDKDWIINSLNNKCKLPKGAI